MSVLQMTEHGNGVLARLYGVASGSDVLGIATMTGHGAESHHCLLRSHWLQFGAYGVDVIVLVDIHVGCGVGL